MYINYSGKLKNIIGLGFLSYLKLNAWRMGCKEQQMFEGGVVKVLSFHLKNILIIHPLPLHK